MQDEINLRDYIEVMLRRWKMITSIAIGLAVIALVFSFIQKPVYEAKTTIMVKYGGGGSYLSQFAGLANLAGINLSYGGGNLNDLIEVLQSKAVAAKVLDDLKLRDRIEMWDNPRYSKQKLVKYVQYMMDKPKLNGNLIELKVEYTDPDLAAEIAKGFTDALSYYWNKLNYTEAQKKKDYIETHLPRVEKELKLAESKLKKFTLLSPKGSSSSGIIGMISKSQSQGIEISRLNRELDIQNTVYTMLRKEFESVKLEESKEIPPFSIVDEAVAPEKPSRPRKKLNTVIGFVLGSFLGTFLAFFKEYWEKTG
jgi:uncharacterized protein involved in exopolysaccharide biosynthesis